MCFDIYTQGSNDYKDGKLYYDCPYTSLAEHRVWMIGWFDAFIEDRYVLKEQDQE